MELVNSAENNNFCHDCGSPINFNGESIENGVFLAYNHAGEKINIFKCNGCFEKSKALTNFQPCEVYSRVVGYLRPVQQWHTGKKQEFKERKEFIEPKTGAACCD